MGEVLFRANCRNRKKTTDDSTKTEPKTGLNTTRAGETQVKGMSGGTKIAGKELEGWGEH